MRTYAPKVSIVVYKRIERRNGVADRVRTAGRFIDLTPFLGDGCTVTTNKHISDPAGTFSIGLTDQVDRASTGRGTLDSLYGSIEPMDYVEIRFARDASRYGGRGLRADLPLVMRGFITDINRSRSMDAEGRPSRRLTISGHDYGKVGQMVAIFARGDYAVGNNWLQSFQQYAKTGFAVDLVRSSEFLAVVVNRLLNPWLAEMVGIVGYVGTGPGTSGSGSIPLLTARASTYGMVCPLGGQPFEGRITDYLEMFADRPWNELFIRDTETGPEYIYRPTPFRTASGKPIHNHQIPWMENEAGRALELYAESIQELDTTRSDANVANYFFVTGPANELQSTEAITIAQLASGTLFRSNEPNSDQRLYGLRRMPDTRTQHYPDDTVSSPALSSGGVVSGTGVPAASTGQVVVTYTPAPANLAALYAALIADAEKRYGIPTNLLLRQVQKESTFNTFAVNPTSGATGLAQILATTAVDPGYGVTPIAVSERTVPAKAITFMAQYMAAMFREFSSWRLALAAYNGGPGNVSYWKANNGAWPKRSHGAIIGTIPRPDENIDYVFAITADVQLPDDPGNVALPPYASAGTTGVPYQTFRGIRYEGDDAITSFTNPGQLTVKLPADQAAGDITKLTTWIDDRRQLLADMNCDNSVFEHGSIGIMGDERMQIGNYLPVIDGSLHFDVYVTGVSHSFAVNQGFMTTLQFERGTGFIARTSQADSPHFAESGAGAYG